MKKIPINHKIYNIYYIKVKINIKIKILNCKSDIKTVYKKNTKILNFDNNNRF